MDPIGKILGRGLNADKISRSKEEEVCELCGHKTCKKWCPNYK